MKHYKIVNIGGVYEIVVSTVTPNGELCGTTKPITIKDLLNHVNFLESSRYNKCEKAKNQNERYKKQVAFWQGKCEILKTENNALRKKQAIVK